MNFSDYKNRNAVGSVTVSESIHGAFIIKDTYLIKFRDSLVVSGNIAIKPGELVRITLNVIYAEGQSSGVLNTGGNDVPYSFYEHIGDDFYESYHTLEDGKYDMFYTASTQHVTGSAEFTALVKGVKQKFKYAFDISRLDT